MNATIMKNDRHMTVNVDRIRPFDRGTVSIEDQHKRDIELAEAELNAINETISELHRKKRQLMLEQQVSTAGVTVEQSQSQEMQECKYPEHDDDSVSTAEDGRVTDLDDDDHHQR